MTEKTPTNAIAHVHGPEQLPGHHFDTVLRRLQEDTIEIDELTALLEKDPASSKQIYEEIDAITAESDFHREIRSLRHAILLLGMNRIYALLNRDMQGPELTIRRTA